jgi:large subunit ribosomal protein L6
MSRIGKRPVILPEKVQFESKDGWVTVKGPLGELRERAPEGVTYVVGAQGVEVVAPKRNRQNGGFQGLARALLANMVNGVSKGYEKSLEINGVGYKAELAGDLLTLHLGFSHPKSLEVPKGIKVEVNKQQTGVKFSGISKQLVGQVAARVRSFKVPEPYKAKGVKYVGEVLRRKVGKAGGK